MWAVHVVRNVMSTLSKHTSSAEVRSRFSAKNRSTACADVEEHHLQIWRISIAAKVTDPCYLAELLDMAQ